MAKRDYSDRRCLWEYRSTVEKVQLLST